MTDGPYKNTKLPKHLEKFCDALHDDDWDSDKYSTFANDCILRELIPDAGLLNKLESVNKQDQMDAVFESHDRTPFADLLRKKYKIFQANENNIQNALSKASREAINYHCGILETRIRQECIRIQDNAKLSPEERGAVSDRLQVAFSAPDIPTICKAIREGNKNAFKVVVNKKVGLDEGPKL